MPVILADECRRKEIWEELRESGAGTLILLGDKPIEWFLRHFDSRWKRLSDFGLEDDYGRVHETNLEIEGRRIKVLPLAHPRQIAGLGKSSAEWFRLHKEWIEKRAGKVFNE